MKVKVPQTREEPKKTTKLFSDPKQAFFWLTCFVHYATTGCTAISAHISSIKRMRSNRAAFPYFILMKYLLWKKNQMRKF